MPSTGQCTWRSGYEYPGGFLKGGDHGTVLEKDDAYESEIFRRITLPVSNRKSMPPSGMPLSYDHIRLIEWWINTGASFEKTLGELEVPKDIQDLLSKKYGVSFKPLQAIDRIIVSAANPETIKAIQATGFEVKTLSGTSNLLEVKGKPDLDLILLDSIKNQITWLDLAGSGWDDTSLASLQNFTNLTRLRLQGNPLTDATVASLSALQHLESLNLNETKITDGALGTLQQIPALRRVYLFETAVTDEAITQLKNARPDLEIITRFQFKPPATE